MATCEFIAIECRQCRVEKALAIHRRAFTLVEIMIVMLVLGILAVIAVPAFVNARSRSTEKTCMSNLREIEEAKEQWAMENHEPATATPVQGDLFPAFVHNWPTCPMAGTYTIGDMNTRPTCTIAGHLLP